MIGVLVRLVGFGVGGLTHDPLQVALAAPTGVLILTGLWNAIPYFLGLTVLIARHEYNVHRGRPSPLDYLETLKAWLRQIRQGQLVVLAVALILGLELFMMSVSGVRSGVVDLLRLAVFVAVVWAGIRLSKRRVVLAQSWPLIIVLLVIGGLVGGLGGDVGIGMPVSFYRFAGNGGVRPAPDGWYAQLGDTGGLVYLRGCSLGSPQAIAVPLSSVTVVQFGNVPRVLDVGSNPSLWQAVVHHAGVSFGIGNPCPSTLPQPPSFSP